jgi:hypothetical protein
LLALLHPFKQTLRLNAVGCSACPVSGVAIFLAVPKTLQLFGHLPGLRLYGLFLLIDFFGATLRIALLGILSESFGLIGNLFLPIGQTACLLLQLLKPLIHVSALALIEQALRALQLLLGLVGGLLLALLATVGALLLHTACSLLQSTAGFGHLRIVLFAGEPLQLPRQPLGFALQFFGCHLVTAALAAALLLHGTTLLKLLLALSKLLQLVDSFFNLLGVLLHFTTLQGLVLVLVLVEFKFKQIGEIFGALPPAATAATATAHGDLDFSEQRFGTH